MTDRAAYVAGLRELADRLDANPDCPLPYDGTHAPIAIYANSADELRAAAKAIGGEKFPNERNGFHLERTLGGLDIRVTPLGSVCERVEVGTTTETREVEVCQACGKELIDGGGGKGCPDLGSEPLSVEHSWFPRPATRTVEVEVPRYETRCPESILAPVETYEGIRARTLREDAVRGVGA